MTPAIGRAAAADGAHALDERPTTAKSSYRPRTHRTVRHTIADWPAAASANEGLSWHPLVASGFVLVAAEHFPHPFHHGVDGA